VSLVAALLLAVGSLVVIVQNVLTDEAWGWLPRLAQSLVRSAVRRLDPSRRDRYQEEWRAELDQFDDRRLTGLAWALRVWLRAGAMRAGSTTDFSSERNESELPAALAARRYVVDEWHDFVAAISEPGLGDVEPSIQAASARFEARLADVRSPALERLDELRAINLERREAAASTEAAAPISVRHTVPGFFDRKPLPLVRRPPRCGPAGAVDPEWTIAPLTGAERRKAEPYVRALAQVGSTWHPAARSALTAAVDEYDHRPGYRPRRERAECTDVRLEVFLGLWGGNEGGESTDVRLLPRTTAR
jgi:hypothetical protein